MLCELSMPKICTTANETQALFWNLCQGAMKKYLKRAHSIAPFLLQAPLTSIWRGLWHVLLVTHWRYSC